MFISLLFPFRSVVVLVLTIIIITIATIMKNGFSFNIIRIHVTIIIIIIIIVVHDHVNVIIIIISNGISNKIIKNDCTVSSCPRRFIPICGWLKYCKAFSFKPYCMIPILVVVIVRLRPQRRRLSMQKGKERRMAVWMTGG